MNEGERKKAGVTDRREQTPSPEKSSGIASSLRRSWESPEKEKTPGFCCRTGRWRKRKEARSLPGGFQVRSGQVDLTHSRKPSKDTALPQAGDVSTLTSADSYGQRRFGQINNWQLLRWYLDHRVSDVRSVCSCGLVSSRSIDLFQEIGNLIVHKGVWLSMYRNLLMRYWCHLGLDLRSVVMWSTTWCKNLSRLTTV